MSNQDDRRLISIVTPVYNEEASVRDCQKAVADLFAGPLSNYRYEHIFADNSSTDTTVAILREMAAEDSHVKVIVNSRNFGPLKSLWNATLATSGDAVVPCLAADLQDPPEVIVDFVKKWEEGHDIVHGIRADRQEGAVLHFVRRTYYRVIRWLANVDIPLNSGEFQLIDRKVVQVLSEIEDYYPYVRGLIAACGFRQARVPYTMLARKQGVSKANWYGMIDIGLNGLISLSNVPMRVCMAIGFLTSGLSLVFAIVSLIAAVVAIVGGQATPSPGIPTLIVGMFMLGGIQLFFLGFLGEYISAIHSQVRRRPVVIEQERINFHADTVRPMPHEKIEPRRMAS